MVLLSNNNASIYLLVALSLISCPRACRSILEGDVGIFTSESTTRPEVRIPHGTVRGVSMVTHHGRNIFGFKGIPFAQPPVGSLRFERPVAAEPWNGILDASNDPKPCPQMKGNAVIGNEDCLYLNVYTPQIPATKNATLLPVMVYVIGGGFVKGSAASASYGPYFILDKDVVLVVSNHRLGLLGYLSTGDEVSPGNYGLKDLVRALEWNRDNIRYFGGDPNQVTLVGGSSGAMSVQLLTLTNLTNGLFHRYILQSGTALSLEIRRPIRDSVNHAVRLGKYFGCSTNTSEVLITCLKSIDTSQLIKTNPVFYIWNELPINTWGPTIEPDVEGAVLTDFPANLFHAGKIRDLPWLASVTSKEGILYPTIVSRNADVFQEFLDKFDYLLPTILQYDDLVDNSTAYTAALKSHYLYDLTADKNSLVNNLTELMSDRTFKYPLHTELQRHLVYAKSPAYLCSFEYRGTFSHSYQLAGGRIVDWGPVHGDEILYLFQQPSGLYGPPEFRMSEADWKMVDTMVQLWTSFVITGKPTMANSNSSMIWKPYSSRKNYLRIGSHSDLEMKYDFFGDRLQFWENLTVSFPWK